MELIPESDFVEIHVRVNLKEDRINEIKINGMVCLPKAEKIDIVEFTKDFMAAKKFYSMYSIQKNPIEVVKPPVNPLKKPKTTHRGNNKVEKEETISRIFSVGIYKSVIVDMYHILPNEFKQIDVVIYMQKRYPDITEATCKTRASGYLKYLVDNKFVEKSKSKGEKHKYRFVKTPFEIVKPDEIDKEWIEKNKLAELEAMRKS